MKKYLSHLVHNGIKTWVYQFFYQYFTDIVNFHQLYVNTVFEIKIFGENSILFQKSKKSCFFLLKNLHVKKKYYICTFYLGYIICNKEKTFNQSVLDKNNKF